MKSRVFTRLSRWLNLPTGVLMALLQRSPALKVITAVGEYIIASPVGTILKGTITAAASLGAVNSLAGATTVTPGMASPLSAPANAPVSVAFSVPGQSVTSSYTVTGTVPPGLAFYPTAAGGTGMTSGTINTPGFILYLRGTPTMAGAFTFSVKGWFHADATGAASPALNYTINVTAPAVAAPVVTLSPFSQTVAPGGSVTMAATATGSALMYQWQKDGMDLAGATSAALTINNLQASNAGDYSVNVSNAGGTTPSWPATLTVATPVAGRLTNLSVRTVAGSGASTLIAGFIIGGAGNKPVVVRGTGQTLTAFGLTGVLPNPLLTLTPLGGSMPLLTNDSWGAAPNVAAITALGLTSFGTTTMDAKDAIMMIPLAAGGYTAQLTDVGGASGLGLVEVFDTDNSAPGSAGFDAQPRLANLSARAQVTTGSGVLIAGFISNGTATHHLLIRATGPTLAALGVAGVLADTQLDVRRLSDGKLFASNDDWGTAPNPAEIIAAGGDKLAGVALNAKESVLVINLPSGQFTAIVSGANNTTGVGLLEIYELP